jgi:hypothetical protein
VQRGPSTEARPRPTDLLEGLGLGPFLEGLLADLEEDGTAALMLPGAHDLHAPLVLDAAGICARPAQMVPFEVGKVVVVALVKLDQLPMPETVSTASTDARLSPDHHSGQDVIAGVAELPISAAAGFFAGGVGDGVAVLAVQARDGVETTTVGEGNLLEALLGEPKASSLAGVIPGRLRYTDGRGHCGLLPFGLEVRDCFGRRPGLVFVSTSRIISRLIAFENGF